MTLHLLPDADLVETPPAPVVNREFVAAARAVSSIAATRMLLLIAVIAGAILWTWTIYDPARDRLYAAVAYSLVFVFPLVLLHWKRG